MSWGGSEYAEGVEEKDTRRTHSIIMSLYINLPPVKEVQVQPNIGTSLKFSVMELTQHGLSAIGNDQQESVLRARIFNFLGSPRMGSKESIPPAYLAWRAGTTTLFLLCSYIRHRLFINFQLRRQQTGLISVISFWLGPHPPSPSLS